jgi:predicted phage terminase large subunit-like protein
LITADIIQGFVGSVLSKRFDDSVKSPEFHRELWELACDPHPYVSIAAPRGHAKSTAGTLAYGLCSLLFRSSKFCVIVSDTEAQAAMFVGAIKQELQDNEQIVELFGIRKNEKGVSFVKDTETDIIVALEDGHMFRVMGKGAEQKLRGLNWNGTRPDLIIVDDLENDELVMNKDRRDKLKRWFRGALLPSLAPKGKIRMWGTILHMDSVLENTMPQENDKFTVEKGLKLFSTNPRRQLWKAVKYKAHNETFSEILWPERFDKDYFVLRREEFIQNGMGDVYSQEYLNRPIDESIAYFKRNDFLNEKKEDKQTPLLYYATADLAISEKERADYSAFVIAGVDPEKKIHIKTVIRERLDGREIVDLILALQRTYDLQAFGIEEEKIAKAIGPFLREEMIKQNTYLSLVPMKTGGKDKIQRARSIQARVRAKSVFVDKEADWYPTFEDEIMKFPRAKHDDQVDAFAYLGLLLDKMIEAPTPEELEEEEYQDEYARSGIHNDGRSRITGY